MPSWWFDEDEQTIATVVAILNEQAEKVEAQSKKHPRR
jgi:hypothetical protein